MCYLGVCYVPWEECEWSNRKDSASIWPVISMCVVEECVECVEILWMLYYLRGVCYVA